MNHPPFGRAAPPERQKKEKKMKKKLGALLFPEEVAALASRIHAEDDNHGYENDRLKNCFHIYLR